ncbi:MAG: type II toxin-antitoxin system HicA family toxin [Phycisphaerales bacterium]|nr:type II toxin-antitoxin system HicA family toxin [Phycisphaerales bacterium]
MSKLPVVTARQVVKLLTSIGFESLRQKGSHRYFRHPDGRSTVVPMPRGEDIPPGLLRSILQDVELSRHEFLRLLRH